MDKKIVNISSFGRIGSLEKTLQSIYNQCDEINLCLNDKITELPDFLLQPKINLYITDNSKGDAFKFMFLETKNGYYLTIDDDLIYPPNYVNFMVDKCKEYNNKKIITLHGRSFYNFPIKSYYNSNAQRFYYNEKVLDDVKVQFGGTGVMCLHTSLLKKSINDFLLPNMADVWIGKFAKENNIDIICVKHEKSFIKSIPQLKTIYDDSKNNDLNQTKIVNKIYDLNTISIIIPTYNNIEYLDESINSIINSGKKYNIEILVGIDGCQKTLDYVKQKIYPEFVNFYYFNSNNGPYIVKNTLSKITNSNKILFFDSDDIIEKESIQKLINLSRDYQVVRPKYVDFNLNRKTLGTNHGEGVFMIDKKLFLDMNGFEPWRVAADTEFMNRVRLKNVKTYLTPEILFKRRIHPQGLTSRKDTGIGSTLRNKYIQLMNNKKGLQNPSEQHIANYEIVTENILIKKLPEVKKTNLGPILSKQPRKIVENKIVKPPKKPISPDLKELLKPKDNVIPRPQNKEKFYADINPIKTQQTLIRQTLIEQKKNTTISHMLKGMGNKKGGGNIGGKFST